MEDSKISEIEQEDPIIMYLVVHELNMSIGKTAAQCAHAAEMINDQYHGIKDQSRILQKQISDPLLKEEYINISRPLSIYGEWKSAGRRKVVLTASDKEWSKLKEEFKDQKIVMVVDAGLTEIPSGSETVIGLWPMRKSQAPKIVKRLQVLK